MMGEMDTPERDGSSQGAGGGHSQRGAGDGHHRGDVSVGLGRARGAWKIPRGEHAVRLAQEVWSGVELTGTQSGDVTAKEPVQPGEWEHWTDVVTETLALLTPWGQRPSKDLAASTCRAEPTSSELPGCTHEPGPAGAVPRAPHAADSGLADQSLSLLCSAPPARLAWKGALRRAGCERRFPKRQKKSVCLPRGRFQAASGSQVSPACACEAQRKPAPGPSRLGNIKRHL